MVHFFLVYLALAAFVLQVWIIFPILFLISFLLISVFHFADDAATPSRFSSRILYGGSIIFLPTLLHATEVLRLFSFLVKTDEARLLVDAMQIVAWPWALGLFITCLLGIKKDWLTALEMFSVAILAIMVSPLAAFTVFFCGMHSARHILRMSLLTKSLSQSTYRIFLAAAIFPTLAVGLVGAVVWFLPTASSFDARLIQIVFVGLAALTAPHMVLLNSSHLFFRESTNL